MESSQTKPERKPRNSNKNTKSKEKTKKGHGRPTSYKPEYDDMAYKFALLGADTKTIATLIGVATSTVSKWMNEIPSFSESVKRGKAIADAEVSESLYNKARGFTHKTQKIHAPKGCPPVTVEVEEYFPPDTTAIIYWLNNRQRQIWQGRNNDLEKERLKLQKERDEFERMIALERIGLDKERLKQMTNADPEEADDGFLEALKETAAEVWDDETEGV